jgi:signal transduction histidine kinase
MGNEASEVGQAVARAEAWKGRVENLKMRSYSASQREVAALARTEAALSRDEAARMRAEAARIRDDGARTRDEGAKVRDSAAVVRDQAARARDAATRLREESLRARLVGGASLDRAGWEQLLAVDQRASEQSHAAAKHDREAAELDRRAAERDREAAEHDRRAAARDRDAAEKDREAADQDRGAADADRSAADADRLAAEREVAFAEDWVTTSDRLASMGRLASVVAHELNNPVTALRMTLDSIRHELGRVSGATRVQELLGDADISVDRMVAVLLDVRNALGAANQQKPMQPVELASIVEQARRLTSASVDQVARFVVDVRPTPAVLGHPGRLAQVLTNLVLNAAESLVGRPGGNEVRVSVHPEGDRARIEVSDTGVGIPPDVLPHIFDAFFTTRTGAGGTGLGLALVKRIVEEHRGTLSVRSQVSVGTTFTVELPLYDEHPPAPVGAR